MWTVGTMNSGATSTAFGMSNNERQFRTLWTSTPAMPIPPPPVPRKLREILNDYPGHLERLQEVLRQVTEKQPFTAPQLDRVIWALEGQLEAFHTEARSELEAAVASGDDGAVASAEAKEKLMSQLLWKDGWLGDAGLWSYFQIHKGV